MGNSRDGYVFISYKSETRDKAAEIQEYLEKAGYKCWRAPKSLQENATNNYGDDIFKAIRNSSCVLCVLSDLAFTSDWVKDEIQFAIKNKKQLIPYVVEDISSDTRENDAVYIKIELNKQILNDPQTGDMSVILPFVEKAFREEQERLVSIGAAPVVVLDSSSVDGVPRLGKPVPIVDLAKLSGVDCSHFQKAIDYLENFKSRSAFDELNAIADKQDPVVNYYKARLSYEVSGKISEEALDLVCRKAIDAGCPDAMRVYAITHLDPNSYLFAPVQTEECLRLLRKSAELGCRDSLDALADAYCEGCVGLRNEELASRIRKYAAHHGSVAAILTLGDEWQDQVQVNEIIRRMESEVGQLSKTDLVWICLFAINNEEEKFHRLFKKLVSHPGRMFNSRIENSCMSMAANCEAMCFVLREEWMSAIPYFKDAIMIGGDTNGEAEYWLAKCYEITDDGHNEKQIHSLLVAASSKGNPTAKYELGVELLTADTPNEERGIQFIEEAVKANCPEALCYSGVMKVSGEQFYSKDIQGGIERLELSAALDNVDAMNAIGRIYADGVSVDVDVDRAITWWNKAAAQGDGRAMRNVWKYTQDKSIAHGWLKKSAEAGNVDSMLSMGDECYNGVGCIPDEEEAAEWYKKAMENGDGFSALRLATMVADGEYEEDGKDACWFLKEAIRLWEDASEIDNADAMCALGDAYSHDDLPLESPFDRDIEKAVSWYKKAADGGNVRAQFCMGRYLTNELGKDYPSDYDEWVKLLDAQELEDRKIGRNMKKAAAYFELIVNGGKSEYLIGALLRLARINRYFDEVEEAKSYYKKAVDNGSEKAPKELEEYIKSL